MHYERVPWRNGAEVEYDLIPPPVNLDPFREAAKHFRQLCMLWSIGKDSTVLLWLARKAFFGHVPFPLVHIDTSYKVPAMIQSRDDLARRW